MMTDCSLFFCWSQLAACTTWRASCCKSCELEGWDVSRHRQKCHCVRSGSCDKGLFINDVTTWRGGGGAGQKMTCDYMITHFKIQFYIRKHVTSFDFGHFWPDGPIECALMYTVYWVVLHLSDGISIFHFSRVGGKFAVVRWQALHGVLDEKFYDCSKHSSCSSGCIFCTGCSSCGKGQPIPTRFHV